MGELSLIKTFRAKAPQHNAIVVGPGHDCAVLNWPGSTDLLFKMDQIIEGSHFVLSGPGAIRPFDVGWKAMAKACSDIAAAGGWPVAATVALNLRKGSDEALALGVFKGLSKCCERFDFGLAGGDFSTSENGLSVAVSLLGKCQQGGAWTRGGAMPGDWLLVTGALGGSILKKHARFGPKLEAARRIRELCKRGVHACIDITDGLSRDARHICDESDCGVRIEEARVPISADAKKLSSSPEEALHRAFSDGEDFELLLAVDPVQASKLLDAWDMHKRLTRIGEIVEKKRGMLIVSENGDERPLIDTGYEHHV